MSDVFESSYITSQPLPHDAAQLPTVLPNGCKLPLLVRDIGPNIVVQADWSSFLRRTGIVNRSHVAYQQILEVFDIIEEL